MIICTKKYGEEIFNRWHFILLSRLFVFSAVFLYHYKLLVNFINPKLNSSFPIRVYIYFVSIYSVFDYKTGFGSSKKKKIKKKKDFTLVRTASEATVVTAMATAMRNGIRYPASCSSARLNFETSCRAADEFRSRKLRFRNYELDLIFECG